MTRTFRSLALGLASLLGAGAMAQTMVTVTGTVMPCAGLAYAVHLESNSTPPLDTVVYTSANCEYSFTWYPVQTQGTVTASVSCDGGITWNSGSAPWQPFLGVVIINLTCGGDYIDCMGLLNGPNVAGTPCDDGIPATDAYWNANCVCVPDTINNWIDCLGAVGGPAVMGSPCNDNDPNTTNDTWNANCDCVGQPEGDLDCLGVPNGNAQPGTACTVPGTILAGLWDMNCVCIVDTAGNAMDCLGVVNGPNMPGAPCDDNNPLTANSVWDANCDCVPVVIAPCEADFWVMQAYTGDSIPGVGEPVPNVLWVWNLSSGGTGNFTFLWNFGDGSSSSDPFPTHTYSGPGPYLLCLTIADDGNCTDTYCDSISVDEDGMISGMAPGAEVRSTFTINVINPLTLGVHEAPALDELATWPNPVTDELNIQLTSSLRGSVNVDILDLSGRTVLAGNRMLTSGANRLSLPTGDLNPGMYLLRIGNGAEAQVLRFVKTR